MAEDNKELDNLRQENAKLQQTISNLELQLKQEQDKNAEYQGKITELQDKAIVVEAPTGVFQFDGVYKSKAGSYMFAPGRKKFIYKGTEYAVEEAIKNSTLMDELIEKGYSGIVKKGGK